MMLDVDVAQNTLEKDLAKYESIWNSFLAGDTSVANENNFQKDVVVVTAQGDLVGINAVKNFYMNYLNGFFLILSLQYLMHLVRENVK